MLSDNIQKMETKCINAQILSCDIIHGDPLSSYVLKLKTSTGDTPTLTCGESDFAFDVLEILDVPTWSRLPKTCLRLKMRAGDVTEMGHIVENNWLIKGDWKYDL